MKGNEICYNTRNNSFGAEFSYRSSGETLTWTVEMDSDESKGVTAPQFASIFGRRDPPINNLGEILHFCFVGQMRDLSPGWISPLRGFDCGTGCRLI